MVRKIVLLLLLVLLSLSHAEAQTSPQEDETVHVTGDTLSYDQQDQTLTAAGNAVIHKGETTLSGDSITVNRQTNELSAEGNVYLKDPRGEVRGDTLQGELEDETGEINNGTITLPKEQYFLMGKRMHKAVGQTYHIENGKFTTCFCDTFVKADWSIGGQTIDVTRQGRAVVHGGTLRVWDMPVMYIPYLSASTNTERKSGLLFPYYGFSSARGAVWQQPFYWDINKSYDATVTTDVETSARLGVIGEFRYMPSPQTQGLIGASYFNEQIRGPATTSTPTDRWSISGIHRQQLPDGLKFYSDLFFVSDDLFLREISHRALPAFAVWDIPDYEIRTRRFTDSHVGFLQDWQHAQFRGEAAYYQDLIQPQNSAFQLLPHLQYQQQQSIWHDRLEAGIAIDGANFYRTQGYAGQRFDVSPSLAVPFQLGPYAFGSVKAIGHETVYHLTSQDVGNPALPGVGQLHGDRTREIVQLQADLATRLSRVFDVHWGRLLQLQHVIEPHVAYFYTPFVGQQDLPLFDPLDRLNQRNLFVYGFDNSIRGKFGDSGNAQTEVRELARFSVLHAYNLGRPIDTTGKRVSDVDVSARVTPLPYMTFTYDSTVDVERGHAVSTHVGAYLSDPRPIPSPAPLLQFLQRQTNIGISYRTVSGNLLKEIDTRLIVRFNEQWTSAFIARYDLNARSFIGDRYYLRYIAPQKCWYIDLAAIDKVNPHEFEFRFTFTLIGLSSPPHENF
jgi:LPS-assembly protein